MAGRKKNQRREGRIYIPYEKDNTGLSWFWILLLCASGVLTPLALLLLGKKVCRIWQKKKMTDYRGYARVIGDRREISVSELSAKLGKTPSLIMSDLQTMIDKGYMGDEAYLDRSRGVLVLASAEAEPIVEEEPSEPVRPAEPEPETRPAWTQDEFEDKLRQIRALNDEIDDEGVSDRIDRIGSLTASIFAVVRQKPERADEVRKFMNYYLPTTFKLLKSYALMEKQSYQGENIVASRRKIENILDSLITAFEQQQDRLFRTEAMDVDADIQVLETMMAKDGLVTPKGLDLRSVSGGK